MEQRTERLAIAVACATAAVDRGDAKLLAGRIDIAKVLRVGQGEKIDDVPAVAFCCELLEAATVCDLLRSNARRLKQPPPELYLSKGGERWARVTYDAVLTMVSAGKLKLHPKAFPSEAVVGPPPKVKPLFGRKYLCR